MYDIVILSTPYIAFTAPAAAPALLKGYLTTQGFNVLAQDYNVVIKNKINNDLIFGELVTYWTSEYNTITLSKEAQKVYNSLLEYYAVEFTSHNTRWIGFSVFSQHSRKFLEDFLPYFQKSNNKQIKVVLGGHGLDILWAESVNQYIDAYIVSEGEIALKELLNGNFNYPGINSLGVQIDDLDQLGFADYSDYDLTVGYENWYDGPMIQITGSRGCVRDCSFCDVANIWKKFKYRTGASVSQEIIQNYEKTGIKHFYFTDSLINGNIKELMNMMRILTDYKQKTGAPITWGGQWISRSQRGLPKDYYSLIKSSGGFNLTMGVETGSDSVRAHMKKNFTNADLDAEMEQFSRHGIVCGFFIILGYPTETEEDFKDTLRMFKRYAKYVASGTITGVAIGRGYAVGLSTPIAKSNVVTFLDNKKQKWKSTVTNANYLENIRRRLIAQQVLNNFKWPSSDLEYELMPIINKSDLLFDKNDQYRVNELLAIKNLNIDPEFIPTTSPEALDIEIILIGNKGANDPVVDIHVNQHKQTNLQIISEQIFKFQVNDCRKRNLIKISLTNKTQADTTVENDQIVIDKSVFIKEIVINGVRIQQPELLMNGRVKFDTGEKMHHNGLYDNGTYTFYFQNPVNEYFIKKRKYYFEGKLNSTKTLLNKIFRMFDEFVGLES
jgi:hypothetical protein